MFVVAAGKHRLLLLTLESEFFTHLIGFHQPLIHKLDIQQLLYLMWIPSLYTKKYSPLVTEGGQTQLIVSHI